MESARQTDGLTSIRFFAAISVLFAHFGSAVSNASPRFVADFIQAGGGAVLYFFILSGFIVSHVYFDRDLSSWDGRKAYLGARFARIVPLYYFTLFLGILGLLHKGVAQYSTGHVIASVLAKLTFLHSFFPALVVDPSWVVATWTLSVEFAFYMLFPFCAQNVFRSEITSAWKQLVVALLLCSLIAPLLKYATEEQYGIRVFYLNAIAYPGFFFAGMVTERLRREYASKVERRWREFLVSGFLGILLVRMLNLPVGADHLLRTIVGCLFILGVFYIRGAPGRFLKSGILILLGEASYALYLLHGPINTAFEIILSRNGLPSVAESQGVFWIYVAVTMGISLLAFRFLETPLRVAILSRLSRKKTVKAATDSTS